MKNTLAHAEYRYMAFSDLSMLINLRPPYSLPHLVFGWSKNNNLRRTEFVKSSHPQIYILVTSLLFLPFVVSS
jgi:hypothetical protein